MKISNMIRARFALAALAGLALVLTLACQSSSQEESKTSEAQDEGAPAQQAPASGSEERQAQQGSSGRTSPSEHPSNGTGQPAHAGSDSASPAEAAYVMVNVPEGKNITIALNEPISSKTNNVGDVFTATVKRDVQTREHPEVIIPAGSVINGSIIEVQKAKQLKGQAKLVVKFDELKLPSGKTVAIVASLGAEGKDTTKRSVGAIAGGAAAGAVLGKIIGKDTKDAAIGAVAGAAIGTGVVLGMDNKDVSIPAGTELILNVDREIEVPVAKTGA